MAEPAGGDTAAPFHDRPSLRPPARLTAGHDVTDFRSEREELNIWLLRHALRSEARTARTYVVTEGPTRVAGFYTLSSGSIRRAELPTAKLRRNTSDPVPVMVLGRLATDERFSGQGIGRGMLKDAITRMLLASEQIGTLGLVTHALDEKAGAFYLKFSFVPCLPIGNRTFLLPSETARAALTA